MRAKTLLNGFPMGLNFLPLPFLSTYHRGFLVLLVGVGAMFWGLAAVCEEYFVPALNILCEELNIPDDVAGATLMAAG
jgi:Ca2+/Na+ antiporter